MKIFKDGLFASLDVVFAPFFLVIATPIFIKYLGINNYGLLVLINSIVASLSLFNFGVNEIIIKFISESKKNNNLANQRNIFSSLIVFQLLLSITVIIVLLLLFWTNTIFNFFKSSDIYTTLIFAIPFFFIKLIEQAVFALHKSYERFDYLVKQSFLSKFLLYSAQITAVILFSSVLKVFQFSLIISLCFLLFQFYRIRVKYDNLFQAKYANLNTFKKVFSGYGKWAWLSGTSAIFNNNIDKWMVSAILGLKEFGYYSIGLLLFNQFYTIITASISWIFPKISSNQLSDKEKTDNHFKLTLFVTSTGLIISVILVNVDFGFILWLGKDVFLESKLYITLFLLLLPIRLMSSCSYYFLLGLGVVKNKFYTDITVLIIKIGIIYITLFYLNLERWPIVYLIPIITEVITYIIIINKKTKLNLNYLIILIICNVLLLGLRFNFFK